MRLLIINYEYPPVGGGAANASWFLARTLVGQGHRVCVLTSAFGKHRGRKVEDGVRVHRIPARRKSIDRSTIGQMMCFAASGLVFAPAIVRAEGVERVIAFFTLPSGLVADWLRVRRGLPYLVSLRGGDVPGLVPDIESIHRRVRWLRRRILGRARAIVANSQGLADLSTRADPFPVAVIPNGVDSEMFRPPATDSSAAPADRLRILFAGRLHKEKNPGLLLEELARLRREGVTAFRLDVVGDGPLAAAMREQARRLDLDDCVVWHGWIDKRELVERYQDADCFVNPSLYESMPNAVLEAMACGLPVVASRVGGNAAIVAEGETGLLFALEEPRQLGRALTRLIRDRSAARRMGAEARARVIERFSWEKVAAEYRRLLDDEPSDREHAGGKT